VIDGRVAPLLTRREYLIAVACLAGAPVFMAAEAVASTAVEHPEWDMDERRTWREWEAAH
jgi:hypothetical protein